MITVDNPLTIEQLKRIRMVKPDRVGRHWRGISHGDFVDALLVETESRGWQVRPVADVSHLKQDLTLGCDICNVPAPDGWRVSFAIETGNSGRRPTTVYVGGRDLKTNAGVVALRVYIRKHTTDDLPQLMRELAEAVGRNIDPTLEYLLEAGQTKCEDDEVDALLIESGRRGLLQYKNRLFDFDRLLGRPASPLDLLVVFGIVNRRTPTWRQLENAWGFTKLVREFFW